MLISIAPLFPHPRYQLFTYSFVGLIRRSTLDASLPLYSRHVRRYAYVRAGIPPPPEGISPSDFLNAPRGASIANLQQQVRAQSTPQSSSQRSGASAGAGRGSAIVAQRRLAQAGSEHHASSPSASPGAGSPGSSGAAGRVTRSRSSSPAVYGSPISFPPVSASQYAPIASSSTSTTSAQPLTSTSAAAGGTGSNNNIPQRFIPILPRPSTSGAFMPSERRDASSSKSTTSISATGPSSLTLKIRQGGNSRDITYQPVASTSQAVAGTSPDGALAARRRTRALQPIDIGLSRDDVYYPTYNPLKRSAGGDAGQVGVGTDMWSAPLGTGQIRPRKRRRRRRNRLGDYNNGGLKGDSSEDDDDTGAREAEREMEASNEFLEDQMHDEQSYISNIQSSYASAFDHTLPLGTPDDPDDADSETPRTARAASRRASMPVLARANSTTKKAAASPIIGPDGLPIKRRPGRPRKYPLQPPATATISSTSARAALEDATDYSDGAMRPPPPIPPILPSIHIDRASSASVSTDEPSRRVARQPSTRASTPASNTFKQQHHQRIPRQLFHRPDKPVEALLERSRFLTPDGRRGSPLPGKAVISGGTGINLAKLAAKQQLTTLEKAALTFESEGDLSSLPSETDEAGETSEFHDSESRFKSERALWRLETADTVAPAFLGSKGGASHGSTPLVASVLQEDVEDPAANGQLATLLDPTRADRPRRGRPPRTASSTPEPGISSNASNDYGKIATQVTVGGLKTRQRPRLDDYPVNDLNEISEIDMSTLRDSYQHVAARKKDMMGAKFLEMPIGDWQVYTPESDIRHT